MKNFVTFVSIFLLFCFIGWIIEVLYRSFKNKRLINPGFMVGCALPIYGVGALVLYLSFKIDFGIKTEIIEVLIKILICSVLLTLVEFIAGYISLKHYHNRLWDYSNRKFNIMGIICPEFSLVWTVLAIVFHLVFFRWLDSFGAYIYNNQVTFLMLGMVMGIFLVDLGYSLKILDKVRKYAKQIEETIDFEGFKASVREKATTGIKKIKSFSIFRIAHRLSAYLDDATHKKAESKDKNENNDK